MKKNNSKISIRLKNTRIIIEDKSKNLLIYSDEVKIVKIKKYESVNVDFKSNVILKSGSISQFISLMKGGNIKVDYRIISKINIFPIYYEGTFEL